MSRKLKNKWEPQYRQELTFLHPYPTLVPRNVAITGSGNARSMRSNHHLSGFITPKRARLMRSKDQISAPATEQDWEMDPQPEPTASSLEPTETSKNLKAPPQVLITTSLLARGLDFVPDTHVLLPDAAPSRGSRSSSYNPNLNLNPLTESAFDLTNGRSSGGGLAAANSSLELLHRAGRAARAGRSGKVILFDSRSAGDRPLINKTGKRVGRVRGRAEKMIAELTRRRR